VPFVVIQSIIVGLVITFPQMVMHYKKPAMQLNQQQIDQQFNNIHIAGIGGAPGGCHRSISASRHEFSDGEIARLHALVLPSLIWRRQRILRLRPTCLTKDHGAGIALR
jgi:hypothetical protein